MRILLPPSETKATRSRGSALDLASLSYPSLNPTREAVLDALVAASARPDALEVLDAPAGAAEQVAANVDLRRAPTLHVRDLYTGVLYDALDHAGLDAGAKRRANTRLVVISALFGALHPNDRVPAYRLSMGVRLPELGPLAPRWREPLSAVLPDDAAGGAIVDLRSATYAAAWKPAGAQAETAVAVHVVRDGEHGRTAVSHMAKHTRGLVARHLLTSRADPRTPEDVADALAGTFTVASLDPPRPARSRRLDVVEP